MTRNFKQIAAASLLGALLPVAAAAQDSGAAQQQGETVKATHGAWEVVCAKAEPDNCVMRQVGKGSDGKPLVVVMVRKLSGVKTDDGKQVPAAIQITTPLGTFLPAGVAIRVDANEPRGAPFEVCVRSGCVVRQPIGDDLLGQLKAGKTAVFRMVDFPEREISVDISLNGFTKAFGSL